MWGKKVILSEETRKKLSETKKGICNMTEENKKKLIEANSASWEITNPDGTKLIIKNLSEFCRNTGLSLGRMSQVSRGIFKQHKGYKIKKL